jgi:aminoglycoside phosphotransferase (APT) family kinase protein
MPHDPAHDPTDILRTLGVTAASVIIPVQGGSDTAVWRVEHGATISALRVFRPERAAACERELAAMEIARAAGVPVPAVRASGTWHDRPALLLSWCPGTTLAQLLRLRPWRLWQLGLAFGRAQARIHQAVVPAGSRLQGDGWIDWAGPAEPGTADALRRLARPAPALLHLDFHPLNVLADGGRVTAVLDWANARLGDARADVARTHTILLVEPIVPGRQPRAVSLVRGMLARSWQRGYEQVAGPLADMAWFYAWAGAVMVRDLAHRVDDPQSWWEPRHLAQIQGWADQWRLRAVQQR